MTTTTTTVLGRGAQLVGDWRHRAGCRDVDPEQFFPAADSGPLYDEQVAEAKAVCAGCPVRAECLAFALSVLSDGIAGGLTPDERRQCAARTRSRRACPAAGAGGGAPVGASRPEVAAAGRAALRAGRLVREVAREFGVTERTADRWAAQVRGEATGGAV